MKEFLEKKAKCDCGCKKEENDKCPSHYFDNITIKDLGMFFWKRGGKEYCFNWKGWAETYKVLIDCAEGERTNENGDVAQQAQSLLDCLACLGEDKIKELIKNMKEK